MSRERGLRAKRNGDQFERFLEIQCRINNYNLIKIPMGAKIVKVAGKPVVKKIHAPFDYILQRNGFPTIHFDAKSRTGDRVSRSDFFDGKSTENQLKVLNISEQYGTKSGFVVWLRGVDKICFLDASKIWTMKPRASFGHDDGLDLGSFDDMKLERLWE